MKTDAYTKVVLTFIAIALMLLVARSLQNPPIVSAQQVRAQHVIIDDLGPNYRQRGLPVDQGLLGTQHVILDNLGAELSLRGLPVSSSNVPGVFRPLPLTTTWQYQIANCSANSLTTQGLLGWELAGVVVSPSHSFTYDPRSGRGLISGLFADDKDNPKAEQYSVCFFKKPSGV
jgi:hypothetical protein